MIKLLNENSGENVTSEFLSFCDKGIFGAVIYTRFMTYGFASDALFWYSLDSDGRIDAVFSLFDSVFSCCPYEKIHDAQTEAFVRALGAKKIAEPGRFVMRLSKERGGAVLSNLTKNNLRGENKEDNRIEIHNVDGENLKYVFPVAFGGDKSRFATWYADASHKIRHSLIHGKAAFADGKIVSVAMTSGETERNAVISSVATAGEYRRRGFATATTAALCRCLLDSGKKIYLTTDDEKTAEIYEKIGFVRL